jgi:hypothetical protein
LSSKQSRKLSPATHQNEPSQKESAVKPVQIKHEPEEEKEVSHKILLEPSDKVVLVKSEFVKPLVKVETSKINPAPKQPCSAYIYFSAETQRREKGTNSIVEIAKSAGERWKNMTAEEKQPYFDQAHLDVER